MEIRSLLFIGRRNAARSLMAESCFNAAGIDGWRAFSAGWETCPAADRLALAALAAGGLPAEGLWSKPVAIFRQPGAPAIDLCVFMDEALPPDVADYPARQEHWRVADPSMARDHKALAYERCLAEIARRVSRIALAGRLAAGKKEDGGGGENIPLRKTVHPAFRFGLP